MHHLPIIKQLLSATTSTDTRTVCFYKRYKSMFITYHASIYDLPFNSNSHVISFIENDKSDMIQYGNIILFLSQENEDFVFIQKYVSCKKQMSNYVELPTELHDPIDTYFPLVSLSDNFTIIPVTNIRHKCVLVHLSNSFCISEIRIDYEHD